MIQTQHTTTQVRHVFLYPKHYNSVRVLVTSQRFHIISIEKHRKTNEETTKNTASLICRNVWRRAEDLVERVIFTWNTYTHKSGKEQHRRAISFMKQQVQPNIAESLINAEM